MTILKTTLLATALLAVTPLVAQAESNFASGPGKLSASAQLDFAVTIPQVLLLQVGASNSISKITFDLSGNAAALGTGPVAGTGGDLLGGKVTAKLLGNVGDVTLSSATNGALSNGAAGDTISYSQITATSSNGFAPPALADTGITSVPVSATNKIINKSAEWTYSYANAAVVAPGTYGAGTTGRVTYTAAMP